MQVRVKNQNKVPVFMKLSNHYSECMEMYSVHPNAKGNSVIIYITVYTLNTMMVSKVTPTL